MSALPAAYSLTRCSPSAWACCSAAGRDFGVLPLAPRQGHHLVLTGQLAVALAGFLLRLVALETGLLMAGAAAKHAAQLEEDHDRQNEKQ